MLASARRSSNAAETSASAVRDYALPGRAERFVIRERRLAGWASDLRALKSVEQGLLVADRHRGTATGFATTCAATQTAVVVIRAIRCRCVANISQQTLTCAAFGEEIARGRDDLCRIWAGTANDVAFERRELRCVGTMHREERIGAHRFAGSAARRGTDRDAIRRELAARVASARGKTVGHRPKTILVAAATAVVEGPALTRFRIEVVGREQSRAGPGIHR